MANYAHPTKTERQQLAWGEQLAHGTPTVLARVHRRKRYSGDRPEWWVVWELPSGEYAREFSTKKSAMAAAGL